MNRIEITDGFVKTQLDIYTYRENGMCIMYSPALDVAGYGATVDAAKQSFEITLSEYLRFTLDNSTLADDLKAHGWKSLDGHEADYTSPDMVTLLRRNKQLRSLVQGDYRKSSRRLSVPVAC